MPDHCRIVAIKRQMPATRWVMMVVPIALAIGWVVQGRTGLAAGAGMLLLGLLALGNTFDIDTAQLRYRRGYHWARLLNPAWQQLPSVQGVLAKATIQRESTDSKYTWQPVRSTRVGYTVLLSVPGSRLGIVVTSVQNETEAVEIAARVAEALQVPWQQA